MGTTVITYLPFKTECQAAVNAYIKAFGGEILFMSRWSGENSSDPGRHGKVMHTEFMIGETRLAAGDTFEDITDRAMKLMIHTPGRDRAEEAIAVLAAGGDVLSPLAPHPKPDDGGMGCIVRDSFGVTWIITCPNPDKTE